jgi:uncharacterized protein (TIGR00156 family)
MTSFKTTLVLATALVSASFASAQYVGPSETKAPDVSVREILKAPVDDQKVVLQGYILRKISREKYIFSDGTAEIGVEIDTDDFPKQPINEKTRVEIRGEVDKHLFKPTDIDVDQIIVLPANQAG